MTKKLYVLVDSFLTGGQKIAQAAHAVGQFALDNPKLLREWNNGIVIIKQSRDLAAWEKLCDASFREPYWENRLTALAAFRGEGFAAELPLVS